MSHRQVMKPQAVRLDRAGLCSGHLRSPVSERVYPAGSAGWVMSPWRHAGASGRRFQISLVPLVMIEFLEWIAIGFIVGASATTAFGSRLRPRRH
jgi:hypothetical protein